VQPAAPEVELLLVLPPLVVPVVLDSVPLEVELELLTVDEAAVLVGELVLPVVEPVPTVPLAAVDEALLVVALVPVVVAVWPLVEEVV
jgi:hypothetical protein